MSQSVFLDNQIDWFRSRQFFWFMHIFTFLSVQNYASERCLCGSVYVMQPLAIWLTCVCRPIPCVVASNYFPRCLGLCYSHAPWLLPVSAASPPVDHEHGTVCQLIWYDCAPSSVISRHTCFSSSLRCCWQVGSAPFVWRRCDSLASLAPITNI